jgi:hypothetical protein
MTARLSVYVGIRLQCKNSATDSEPAAEVSIHRMPHLFIVILIDLPAGTIPASGLNGTVPLYASHGYLDVFARASPASARISRYR